MVFNKKSLIGLNKLNSYLQADLYLSQKSTNTSNSKQAATKK